VVARVRERPAGSKQATQKFDVETLNVRKLRELEVRKQYQIEITNRFAALENLNESEDIKGAWENKKENIKTSAKESLGLYEMKQHKQWFNEECSQFLDQNKQAKMQWLQDPKQSNAEHLRHDVSRHFRNKMKEYLKVKIDELEKYHTCIGAPTTLRRVTILELK
jgi:hypothetical protein